MCLRLHLLKTLRSLLNVFRKVGHFLYLADFDHFILRCGTAGRPFDGLLFGLHLNHPIAPQHFFRLDKGAVDDCRLSSREGDTRTRGWRMQTFKAKQYAGFCNDSLYRIMAATALASGMVPGAAFSYPFGIISIMNRIVIPPVVSIRCADVSPS